MTIEIIENVANYEIITLYDFKFKAYKIISITFAARLRTIRTHVYQQFIPTPLYYAVYAVLHLG